MTKLCTTVHSVLVIQLAPSEIRTNFSDMKDSTILNEC